MALIVPTVDNPQGVHPQVHWANVTENDTVDAIYWPGGKGYFEITGDFGGATITLDFGLTEGDTYVVDDRLAPEGGLFTLPALALFDLPVGYLKATATGGSGQSVNIRIFPGRKEV